jgi:hypothetical protein
MLVLISVRGGERWHVIRGVQIAGTWMKVGSTVVISVGNYVVTRVGENTVRMMYGGH